MKNLAVLVGLSGLLLSGCAERAGEQAPAAAGPAIRVHVERVVETAQVGGLEVSGTLHPLRRAMPGTVLIGRVERVLHREGDAVAAGAVLARVESREVQARLAQAQAGVEAARAAERNALGTRQRLERLVARSAASQKSVEDAVAQHDAAVAQRQAAEQAVAAARTYVAYADVVAPFAGVVVERRVEVGDMAAPGATLFVIDDLSRVNLEAQVPEAAALALAPKTEVDVELPAADPAARRGTIDEVLPTADAQSRTFTLRVALDNADGHLRSGMYGRVRLPGASETSLSLPASAVLHRGPLAFAFVVGDDGAARLRALALGRTQGDRIVVSSGLRAGESIVADPPAELADGMRVETQ
jgi:RND family efflux transporter MFP subunit